MDLKPNLDELEERDVEFEEDLQRNPYNLKTWWHYVLSKSGSKPMVRYLLYERAVKHLPGSYKLWCAYLTDRLVECNNLPIHDPRINAANNAFERAITFMHKMPRIWLMYLEFLMPQFVITRTRKTFDKSLMSLPITQHDRVWPLYLKFVRQKGMPPETAVRVYRRYIKLEPENVEEFIKYLKSVHRLDEAAQLLAGVVNNEKFVSQRKKSKHKLWQELCNLMCKNPHKVTGLNVDAILRGAIRRYTNEVGRLWTSLAEYYTRLGQFEKARDVYEEGITTVTTVRDFGIVFDAYSSFEENMIQAKMDALEAAEGDEEQEEMDDVLDFNMDGDDIDLRMARLENLMERRPLLVSSVLLRQNPHNVLEWMKRVKIFKEKDQPDKVIHTFAQAVKTVDPFKASGRPHTLWVNFAKFYEEYATDEEEKEVMEKYLDQAREVFTNAVNQNFRGVDDLASIWCELAEFELRHENFDGALKVMQRATVLPNDRVLLGHVQYDPDTPVQQRVYRSTKLWSFYVDLEESLGTLATTKSVYEKILDLKISTPQIVINYANFMEEHKYFEDSFRVYERGVSLFKYPHVLAIWLSYLQKFIKRYKGKKLERTRELFEQAVERVPSGVAKKLFIMYANFEEKYGSVRHALKVYDKACDAVQEKDQNEMFLLYIKKTTDLFGPTKTREIYEKAIKSIPDSCVPEMCKKFSAMEETIGELERARAIYVYGSQFADPRGHVSYWSIWKEFEVRCGNKETYMDLSRVQRTIETKFMDVQFVSAGTIGGEAATQKDVQEEAKKLEDMDNIERLEVQALETQKNDEEIELDDDEDLIAGADNPEEINLGDEEPTADEPPTTNEPPTNNQDDDQMEVQQIQVPDAVFGSAKRKAEEELGALERFKRKKAQKD